MDKEENVTFVLGPTNTGKTHFAIEKMITYSSGIIGLPLRLLAREIYDKLVLKEDNLATNIFFLAYHNHDDDILLLSQ